MNCAVLTALPAYSLRAALRERPSASLRAAQIIGRSSGPFPPFTKRAQQKLSRFVRTSAQRMFLGPRLSLVGTPGRLRVGQAGWNLLAGARPRSIDAVPGKERERCSLSARRCACAALTWCASVIPRRLAMSRANASSAEFWRVAPLLRMSACHLALI
jgi:hypothetical protein